MKLKAPPLPGELVQTGAFNEPRANGPHKGNDLRAAVGTEVYAVDAGRVTDVWFDSTYGGGLSMTVTFATGGRIGYAHLDRTLVEEGTDVSAGELVALSGASGPPGTKPHLHVTLRDPSGSRIDAWPLLQELATAPVVSSAGGLLVKGAVVLGVLAVLSAVA